MRRYGLFRFNLMKLKYNIKLSALHTSTLLKLNRYNQWFFFFSNLMQRRPKIMESCYRLTVNFFLPIKPQEHQKRIYLFCVLLLPSTYNITIRVVFVCCLDIHTMPKELCRYKHNEIINCNRKSVTLTWLFWSFTLKSYILKSSSEE